MADELLGHGVDAGLAGKLTRGQLGQGAVVAPRQVAAHGACLGDHEVKVVEQPFGGGGHCLALVHVLRQQAIGGTEQAQVLLQARQEVVVVHRLAAAGHAEDAGQGLGPLVQALQ